MKIYFKIKCFGTFSYDNFGNLGKVASNEDTYKYNYDFAQRISRYIYNDFIINYDYDENSNVIDKDYKLNDTLNNMNYTYNEDNSITKTELDSNEINYIYDSLGRLIEKNINDTYKTDYEYITNGNKTSLILKSMKNDNDELKYKYDELNNITHIYQNDSLINKYEYDNHNQLTREDDYTLNKTIRYTYDNSGNILSKREYELNTYNLFKEDKYEYNNPDWEDQLTKYTDEIITYDNIGNPLTIGEDIELTWTNGRELNSYTDASNTINYKYNKDGIRISKEVNNVNTMYYLENNNIIFEETESNMIYYLREVNGNLIGFKYNGTMYYYIKNAQEDIVGVLDSSLDQVVTYEYNSWGNIISITDGNGNDVSHNLTHIGNINPFRYRSYYFDKETNLYYLNSRYYNPVWSRFLNADNYISNDTGVMSYNMYSYCNNNPIINTDPDGHFIIFGLLVAIVAVVAVVTAVAVNTVYQANKAKKEIDKVQKKLNVPDKSKELDKKLKHSASEIKKATTGQNPVQKLNTFKEAVTDNSKYDLKEGNEWGTTISYNGIIMEPQDIGNFHYGYIGRSIGIPTNVLLLGASFNQMTKLNMETLRNCFTLTVCDDPRDAYYIRMGAIKYDNGN